MIPPHYYHLLLWNSKDRAIAGAYRLGKVGEILETQGVQGLYSSTLFQMDENFLATCGKEGLELGRALVTAPYQRDFYPLLLLWKGIATFIYRHNLRHLFGPASLSLAASGASLELITTLLASQYASESLEGHIQGRNTPSFGKPDRARAMILAAIERGEIDFRCVDRIVRGLDMGRGIPVLFRHYLQLNGKIAAFHEDKDFNSLDAFLFVDTRTSTPSTPSSSWICRRPPGQSFAATWAMRQQRTTSHAWLPEKASSGQGPDLPEDKPGKIRPFFRPGTGRCRSQDLHLFFIPSPSLLNLSAKSDRYFAHKKKGTCHPGGKCLPPYQA